MKTTRQNNAEMFTNTSKKMRTWLNSLIRRRQSGTVTADDIHTYLDRQGVSPREVRTRLRFINSMFGSGEFVPVGYSRSTRPVARGRTITEWTTL